MGRAVKKVHRPLQRDVQLYSKTLLQPKHRSLPAVTLDVHAGMFVHDITAPAMGVQVLSLSRFTITPTLNFCCFLIEYFSLYMWLYTPQCHTVEPRRLHITNLRISTSTRRFAGPPSWGQCCLLSAISLQIQQVN